MWIILAAILMAVVFILMKPPKSEDRKTPNNWRTSENGNQTLVHKGKRLTVFPRGGCWAYASGSVQSDEPHFSKDYDTATEATQAALYDVFGIGEPVRSRQEVRKTARLQSATFRNHVSESLIGLRQRLPKDTQRVEKSTQQRSGPPRVKTLKTDLIASVRRASHNANQANDAEMKQEAVELSRIGKSYQDLFNVVEQYERSALEKFGPHTPKKKPPHKN